MQVLSEAIIDLPPTAMATTLASHLSLTLPSHFTLQTFSAVQFWLEGIFFTAFGIVGLVGALVTIGVLATKDLRDS